MGEAVRYMKTAVDLDADFGALQKPIVELRHSAFGLFAVSERHSRKALTAAGVGVGGHLALVNCPRLAEEFSQILGARRRAEVLDENCSATPASGVAPRRPRCGGGRSALVDRRNWVGRVHDFGRKQGWRTAVVAMPPTEAHLVLGEALRVRDGGYVVWREDGEGDGVGERMSHGRGWRHSCHRLRQSIGEKGHKGWMGEAHGV